jgi:hypothetical protein
MAVGKRTLNALIGVVILLIILVIAVQKAAAWRHGDKFTLERTREVRSQVDGLPYRVHLIHSNSDDAADVMAKLNSQAIELMRHLRRKYLRVSAHGVYSGRKKAAKRLLALYNPDNLAENSPRDPEGDTSYTIDKGAILAICLREKDPGRKGRPDTHDIHDIETLTFVVLHELTHIAIEDVDHPPVFWETFKFILQDAREAGIIRGVDYSHRPTVYCGMDIDYNPLFDRSLTAVE